MRKCDVKKCNNISREIEAVRHHRGGAPIAPSVHHKRKTISCYRISHLRLPLPSCDQPVAVDSGLGQVTCNGHGRTNRTPYSHRSSDISWQDTAKYVLRRRYPLYEGHLRYKQHLRDSFVRPPRNMQRLPHCVCPAEHNAAVLKVANIATKVHAASRGQWAAGQNTGQQQRRCTFNSVQDTCAAISVS